MVLNALDTYRDVGLLIVRMGLGISFMFAHGQGKLFAGPETWAQIGANAANVGLDFFPVFWGFMAGLAEFGGGLLLLLGFLFRPALFLLICTMITAAASHVAGTVPGGPLHAVEMGIVFLALFFTGPGQYSLDAMLAPRDEVRAETPGSVS